VAVVLLPVVVVLLLTPVKEVLVLDQSLSVPRLAGFLSPVPLVPGMMRIEPGQPTAMPVRGG
jgi:hypothetical protein